MCAPSLFFSPGRWTGLVLLKPLLALAQIPPPAHAAASAADPAVPSAPMVYWGIAPAPANEANSMPQDWRAAHEAVGAFPRGHADILVWEKQQAAESIPAQPPSTEKAMHSGSANSHPMPAAAARPPQRPGRSQP